MYIYTVLFIRIPKFGGELLFGACRLFAVATATVLPGSYKVHSDVDMVTTDTAVELEAIHLLNVDNDSELCSVQVP